jgi:hypothetical protein
MEEPTGLRLTSGGHLLHTRWIYDDERDEGHYVTEDVTQRTPEFLFYICILDEDIILKDIFLLLEHHLDLYEVILSKWVKAIVEEGLAPIIPPNLPYDYVELYWSLNYVQYEGQRGLSWNTMPRFHAVSDISCAPDLGKGVRPATQFALQGAGDPNKIVYSIDFTPANELAELPLKLSPIFTIWADNPDGKGAEPHIFTAPEFSLAQIFDGILWELTFHGGPADRQKAKCDLDEAIAEANTAQNTAFTEIL